MSKTTRILLGSVASLALVTPTIALAGTAQATDGATTHAAAAAKPKAKKKKLAISAAKGFIHAGLTTDTVTVKAKGFRKGKVKFTINGADAGTVKLKKRTATLAIPASLPVGEHVVKAKVKKAKAASVKILSHNTSMTLATTAVTVNRATYDAPEIPGQVIYKGNVASEGYVDYYHDDGAITFGSDSPDLLGVRAVDVDGTFEIFTYEYLDYPPGTYTMKAYFEYDAGYDEYLFGTPITITVI